MNKLHCSKKVFLLVCLTGIIFCLRYFIFPWQSVYTGSETTFEGVITKIQKQENYWQITIDAKEPLLGTFYTTEDLTYLQIGTKVQVIGTLEEILENTIPNLYSWKNFYRTYHTFYRLKIKSLTPLGNTFSFKEIVSKWINQAPKTSPYLKWLFLNDSSNISSSIKDIYQRNGTTYLFSFSGIHLAYLLRSTKKYPKLQKLIIIFLCLIIGTKISFLRAILSYLFLSLFKKRLSQLEGMLLVLCLLLTINPFYINQIGFWYSIVLSSSFLLITLPKTKTKIGYLFEGTCFAFLISLPLTLFFFYKVNLGAPIINTIIVIIFNLLLFPFLVLTLIFPLLDVLTGFLLTCFEQITIFLNSIFNLPISYGKTSLFCSLLWVFVSILGVLFLKTKKRRYLLSCLALFGIILINRPTFEEVTFLDVGQGDSIYLSSQGKNMLLDTGNTKGNDIISFLESKGVSQLDYLILSHGDSDHLANALAILEKIPVNEIIYNAGEINSKEQEILSFATKNNIKTSICFEAREFSLGDFSFYSLTQSGSSENQNSCIFYVTHHDTTFFFGGDMEESQEQMLIKKYSLDPVTYLKVSHHGSKTSSTLSFLQYLKPEVAIISVGKNNIYNHPSPRTIENLTKNAIPYYLTCTSGSIEINLKDGTFKTYPPYTMVRTLT